MHKIAAIIASMLVSIWCHSVAVNAVGAQPSDCLKISTEDMHPKQVTGLKKRLEQLYQKAGLCISWVDVNTKRATALLLTNELDGNLARTQAFAEEVNSVAFPLDVPLYYGQPSVLFLSGRTESCDLQNMRGLRVGYQLGVRWFELEFAQYDPVLVPLPNSRSAALLMERGRITAYAFDGTSVRDVQKKLQVSGVATRLCNLPVMPVYHLLHNRHKDKKARLEAALTSMPPYSLPW